MKLYLSLLILFSQFQAFGNKQYSWTGSLMGSDFEFIVIAKNQEEGDRYLKMAIAEVQRIEKLISSWDPNSEISEINNSAGVQPVKVGIEVFKLIERCVKISELTSGAFDISYASIDYIWKFNGEEMEMPEEALIQESISKIGYNKIILNKEKLSVYLPIKGMKIGFGAIGKGYAADKVKSLLIANGVKSAVINASGDLNAWGKQENGEAWVIGISNPAKPEEAFGQLKINNEAVVTSGNYRKFLTIDGVRYAHIINPKTGIPTKGILSATVVTESAEIADALATALFVLGVDIGIDLINQIKEVECIIVDDESRLHYSDNIKIN